VSDTDKEILNRKAPEVGALVLVRSRRWLVEEVKTNGNGSPLVRLACADDDAQGSYVMGPLFGGRFPGSEPVGIGRRFCVCTNSRSIVMMLLIPARATGGVEVVDWQPVAGAIVVDSTLR